MNTYFPPVHEVKMDLAGRELKITHGKYARQADGAVTVSYGDTVILATCGVGPGNPDAEWFPMSVDYIEKWYAAGKISGSRFVKREAKPSEQAILTGRLIDRPIRPLFPKGITNTVQIIASPMSIDLEVDPGTTAMIAASCAVALSGLPFEGPIGAVRVGLVDDKLVINPNYEEAEGRLNLVVAGTSDAITMVEARADEVSNDIMIQALELAHSEIKKICALQTELINIINPEPFEPTFVEKDKEKNALVLEKIDTAKLDAITGLTKGEVKDKLHAYQDEIIEMFAAEIEAEELSAGLIETVVADALDDRMRHNILQNGNRIDGRGLDDVRTLKCEVGVLPRPHGTGLFQRGETQVLSYVTLAGPGAAQIVDVMDKETEKRYMHHYMFPPFSVGDTKPLRGVSRREVGHGDLAERALLAVIPSKEEFPYTIRVASEVLACNGSSSMGSVCGSTLSLMHAGVPIKKPVSGIAMGLVTDGNTYRILTDIQGLEDFAGDMDFKVTGTEDGITALQMDIKVKGLSMDIMREALAKADQGRAVIMDAMMEAINTPNLELSPYAPMIESFMVDPDMIRLIIGKGGETIQGITAETEVEINIEDDGQVVITAPNQEAYDKAKAMIDAITYVPTEGDEFDNCEVVKILDGIGALVEFAPGKVGMVHISKLAPKRVEKVEDVVKVGDRIKVKLMEIKGDKFSLSHKEYYKG
jgi:polyribonucleotide nucleotidyltransferase